MKSSKEMIKYKIQPNDNLNTVSKRFNTDIYEIKAINPGVNLNFLRAGQSINIRPDSVKHYSGGVYDIKKTESPPAANQISQAQLDLSNQLRSLWVDQIMWGTLAINDIIYNLPGMDFVNERLIQNADDFTRALIPYYGEESMAELRSLIEDFIITMIEYYMAYNAGNANVIRDVESKLRANVNRIITFLTSINPYLSRAELETLYNEYIDATKSQIANFHNKDFNAANVDYDRIKNSIFAISDTLVRGIVNQFPDRFI